MEEKDAKLLEMDSRGKGRNNVHKKRQLNLSSTVLKVSRLSALAYVCLSYYIFHTSVLMVD